MEWKQLALLGLLPSHLCLTKGILTTSASCSLPRTLSDTCPPPPTQADRHTGQTDLERLPETAPHHSPARQCL